MYLCATEFHLHWIKFSGTTIKKFVTEETPHKLLFHESENCVSHGYHFIMPGGNI